MSTMVRSAGKSLMSRSPVRTNALILTVLLGFFVLSWSAPAPAAQQNQDARVQREEIEDYFLRWLNEDVVYIVTEEEREVFSRLTTDEERENFIEQFWRRRDPDLKTTANEFQEEHYRRIAYANEHFGSGQLGWKSDRGRIYIIHGPPDEIQDNFGGPYERPSWEGGGQTTTFPYQVWRYRHIDGLGEDIELEFVDKTLTGGYRLTNDPFDKDAFANVPNIGLTEAEEKGMAWKIHRFTETTGSDYYPRMYQRYQDKPFIRLETYAGVMRPAQIKYQDLKNLVNVDISYTNLPFRFHQDHFRLNQTHCIVPLTVELMNRHLTFSEEDGVQTAKTVVYGIITGLGQEILKEFEDEVLTAYRPEAFERGRDATSLYQKIVVLEKGKRVKLTLVVKDVNSGNTGVLTRVINPPAYTDSDLELSSLVLSDTITPLDRIPEQDEMFVLGDVKVRPSLDRTFNEDRLMGIYLQLYNVGVDSATFEPALSIRYRLFRDGKELYAIPDDNGESIQFFSAQRLVLTRVFSPAVLGPGKFRIQVDVEDKIKNQKVSVGQEFEVIAAERRPMAEAKLRQLPQ